MLLDVYQAHGPNIIAFVDARPEDYWQLAEAAEARGFHCRYATTAEQALQLAKRGQPAFWLVNLHLPDMTGLELCRLLRPRLSGAPHFLIADRYDPGDETAVLAAGGHFLCKPLPHAILDATRIAPPRLRAPSRASCLDALAS